MRPMIGAIAGDVIGSSYEGARLETAEFPLFSAHSRFTDDTVLPSTTHALLTGTSYADAYHSFGADRARDTGATA